MSSSGFYPCFNCGRTNEFPQRSCSNCEMCGFSLNDGVCLSCNPTYNSFDYSLNFSDHRPQPQYPTYFCDLCVNEAHYGYDCQSQVPFDYNQDPSYNQNFNYFPQDSQSFSQQKLL